MKEKEETEERVLDALKSFWSAYESGSLEFFDYFTEDVRLFPAPGVPRLVGIPAYRQRFESELQARKRAMQVFDLDIRPVGEQGACATYHCRIRIEAVSGDYRVTVVLVKDEDGRFNIAHLHASSLVHPESSASTSADDDDLVEDIMSLEDRT